MKEAEELALQSVEESEGRWEKLAGRGIQDFELGLRAVGTLGVFNQGRTWM